MQRPKLLILFGSQTGTAEEVARRISREAQRRHFSNRVCSMDDFASENKGNLSRLNSPQEIAVFVCSTTGQGEMPENMQSFWRLILRRHLTADYLDKVQFTVFGLGDSSYLKFNFAAKKLFKRLLQLGAQSLHPRGDGDDQHYLGFNGALDNWLDNLWNVLLTKYPLPKNLEILPPFTLLPASFDIVFAPDKAENPHGVYADHVTAGEIQATVLLNRRMTPETHFQDIRYMEFQYPHLENSYNPGDIMTVRPRNSDPQVEELLQLLGWSDFGNRYVTIRPKSDVPVPGCVPPTLTVRQMFTCCLDIWSTPRDRYFFELLSHFALDTVHQEKLREFCTAEGQEELYSYSNRPRRTSFEIMQDFQPLKIPLTYLLDLFPIMRPREFSISSAAVHQPGVLSITMGVITYKTKMKLPRMGVCTHWLATLKSGDRISIGLKEGTLKLPPANEPIIMISPGLGVAPMRALIQQRIHSGFYENLLFYGCRYPERDFLFQDDFERWKTAGQLEYFVAFSRAQDQKIYVQDHIRQRASLIWDLVHHKQAWIFVSGNSKNMPDDVQAAFKDVFAVEGKMSEDESEAYLQSLLKKNRYQQETWS